MSVGKPTYWMHLSAEPETVVSMLETLGAVNTDLQGGVLNQLSNTAESRYTSSCELVGLNLLQSGKLICTIF